MNNEIKKINITFPGQILDYVDTKEHLLELFNYITNLQQENQDIKDTLQDKLDYIGHLKELCDKYEEEHNTTFIEWANTLDRNKKAIKYINTLKTYPFMDRFYIKDLENILNNGDDK